MARLGMTSLFSDVLLKETSPAVRKRLLELVSAHPGPQVAAAMQFIARNDGDPLKTQAEAFLRAAPAWALAAGSE
jgi:hypothetical protein